MPDLVFAQMIASVVEERGTLHITTQAGRTKAYGLGDQCAAARQVILTMLPEAAGRCPPR